MLKIEENPTRKKIILLLNKEGQMTVSDISKKMGITPMAVRQHLMSLEKRGIIKYVTKKYGIGRPVFLYYLTEKANEIFPKSYDTLLIDLLGIINKLDGRKKIDKLFLLRKDRLVLTMRREIDALKTLEEKVAKLVDILDNEGYMVEMDKDSGKISFRQFNCMLGAISKEYPEACKYELDLYSDLLGAKVERSECQRDGSNACIYVITNFPS